MRIYLFLFSIVLLGACQAIGTDENTNTTTETNTTMHYDDYPTYEGNDLGVTYTPDKTSIKVWSPAAEAMTLRLYEEGEAGKMVKENAQTKQVDKVWLFELKGDMKDKFYTVQAKVNGEWLQETADPNATAVGINGQRGMIVDLDSTNPENWEEDKSPPLKNFTDIIIYELHVRDMSIHPSSGIKNKGKFLGLVEAGTRSPSGEATGLDHFKELGVTHIHLLPSFNFMPRSVDEKNPDAKYNWGYDPQHYSIPEGAYSTDPYDGNNRITEFKKMVQTFHDNGLRVVLDVVYNHTGETENSVFNQVAPGYYYRHNEDGTWSNASGCGNETASERPMVRKFMLESMKHWVKEYHIDGFRVDLMAIHDIETMNIIAKELHKIDPSIFIYGEGWTAGDSPLPVEKRALKAHGKQLDKIAVFSDDLRDGLKGSVFEHEGRGFVSGQAGTEESIKFGIVASTQHPQVNYEQVNYSKAPYSNNPTQTISYVSCHDNHTLFDKLKISCPDASEEEVLKMHRLANTIVLTSQGVPFLHAGADLVRTKDGVENSYESPDSINQLDWERKTTYKQHFEYYKKLVQLRKNHPAFRMTSTEMVQEKLTFLDIKPGLTIGYQLSDNANGDSWKDIIVLLNGNKTDVPRHIPSGEWTVVLRGDKINENGLAKISNGQVLIPAMGAMILKR